ncbi:hypothetical protein F9817_16985 [Vibrio sp. CAIM 722]|uniref:MotA/TolQ/ExbB proton channel domain-containing protein n=1 Tax=Vibrio eleionomae TaxID=2653505 RepID=A0A7X4LMS8_9VIBR|nr:MotA/TolQ/ExbB proton channel family protein [Vibrio eleionomae]MZI94873.1 hypothetical protein [Vibrio eleionomae]
MLNDTWALATAIPLILCSLIALSLIFDRGFAVLGHRALGETKHQEVSDLLKQGQIEQAKTTVSDFSKSYQQAIGELNATSKLDKHLREEALSLWLGRYTKQLRRRLSGLTTVATLAPMLGLLGTIVGLMRSFHDIGLSHGPVEPAIVADGLWQALSTTAAGMVIAVICVMCHALFQSRIRYHLSDVTDLLNQFTLSQEIHEVSHD